MKVNHWASCLELHHSRIGAHSIKEFSAFSIISFGSIVWAWFRALCSTISFFFDSWNGIILFIKRFVLQHWLRYSPHHSFRRCIECNTTKYCKGSYFLNFTNCVWEFDRKYLQIFVIVRKFSVIQSIHSLFKMKWYNTMNATSKWNELNIPYQHQHHSLADMLYALLVVTARTVSESTETRNIFKITRITQFIYYQLHLPQLHEAQIELIARSKLIR